MTKSHFLRGVCLLFLLSNPFACKKEDATPVVIPAPAISSLDPAIGGFGTQVTITGSNFGSTAALNTVSFNGKPATIVSANTSSIVAQVPDGAGTGPVMVTTGGKSGSFAGSFTYRLTATTSMLIGDGSITFKAGQGTNASVGGLRELIANPANEYLYGWQPVADGEQLRKFATDGTVSDVVPAIKSPIALTGGQYAFLDHLSFSPSGRAYCIVTIRNSQGTSSPIKSAQVGFVDTDGSLKLLTPPATSPPVTFAQINGLYARTDAELYVIGRVTINAQGEVDKRLYKITSSGYTFIAGGSGGAMVDGKGAEGRFGRAEKSNHLTADKAGNLFVVDNACIRKVTPDGMVTTLAGSGVYAPENSYTFKTEIKDGQGRQAILGKDDYLTIDNNDNLYLTGITSGYLNNYIRKVSPDGTVTTLISKFPDQNTNQLTPDKYDVNIGWISGAAPDKQGNLYFANLNNTNKSTGIWKLTAAH